MKIVSWNIRGLSTASRQKGVKALVVSHNVDIVGLLETKLDDNRLRSFMTFHFSGWNQVNNFDTHVAGRILVLWNPSKVSMEPISISPQVIHFKATCKVSSVSTRLSFIYGLHSIIDRRPLWTNLSDFSGQNRSPWLLLGDFNNVLCSGDRQNGVDVTPYEIRDFEDFCSASGVSDLQYTGSHFTWSNDRVWSKIDRAMGNFEWYASDFFSHVNFLTRGSLSDHSACVITIFHHEVTINRPFKFFKMWTSHVDYTQLVTSEWGKEFIGTQQYILCCKLKALKGPLKELNNLHFSHIFSRAKIATAELENDTILLQADPNNAALKNKVKCSRVNAQFLEKAAFDFFSQKAKCTYINQGDRGTKFFHAMVKRNANRRHISAITLEDGSITTSSQQVADEFVGHFKNLLGTSDFCTPIDIDILNLGPKLENAEAIDLVRAVSSDEIKRTLFSIADDKSPGPDGFSAHFYKKSWDIVGVQFCKAIKEFFESRSLLKQVNHTTIALVPKSDNASSVSDYRPIACCNVTYKVISKIIAARLGPVLNSIIDPAQAAGGRSMIENIHLAQEMLRKYHRKRSSPRCTMKVDLRKAYDSVCWSFLKSMLEGLDFPSIFVDWIMQCVSTPSYSIAGGLNGMFKGEKGLRQGDPLSPFLFVICLEYFSRILKKATTNTDFHFHPRCGQNGISHLAFADDLMLFARGDSYSVKILMDSLHKFGSTSGLHSNVMKSNLYTAGIVGYDLDLIQSLTDIPVGSMPFSLVYRLLPNVLRSFIMLHLLRKLRHILIPGRLLPYLMLEERSSYDPYCKVLNVFGFRFSLYQRKTTALVSWAGVCLPKTEGGLGFRDLKSWNTSLLAKCFWDIHLKKDSLWVKWVHSIFLRGDKSVWDWKTFRDDSPLLKRILAIRDLVILREGSIAAAKDRFASWADGDHIILSST
ncbi:hypothetical protein CASFOL_009575 [Castilleja foliolosa]|uniref:Reverse transcriptase domain-containing protein n=1 Tax=Castilleja foliolosa TaxID=1961234 RepID=A0ABD3DWT8_9LAMI